MSFHFLEAGLRRDRMLAVIALSGLCISAWAYTVFGVGMSMSAIDMTLMPANMQMPSTNWNVFNSVSMFAMWWVMMIAMMLPSAAPMLLLYLRVAGGQPGGKAINDMAVFALGYLVIWGAFSLGATVLQAIGEQTGLVNGMIAGVHREADALLLLGAGAWQLTPVKHRCMEACRSPIPFLSQIWVPGRRGAFRMGLCHGLFCVGCCWAMMMLLFVGGAMNLYWIGGLALLALAEKTMPNWHRIERHLGMLVIVWSAVILITGL